MIGTSLRNIRLLIADDHFMVRAGLRFALQLYPEIEIVGEASHGHDVFELCRRVRPDVMLLDLKMPDTDGIMVARTLHHRYPDLRIIAITSISSSSELRRAVVTAGAVTCLQKQFTIDELVRAIRGT